VAERYGSFDSPLGRKIRAGEATLAELSDLAVKNGAAAQPGSGRQEWLEAIVNTVLFRG
jgi:xylose isomerase